MSIYTPQQEFPRNELPRLLEREAGYYAALELCELVLRGEMDPTDEERVQAEEMKLDLLQRIAKVRGEISSKTPTPPSSIPSPAPSPDLTSLENKIGDLETHLTEVRDRISQLGNIPTQPPQSPSPTSSAPTSQELRRLYVLINSLTDEIHKLKKNSRLTPLSNLGRILKALEGREVRLTDGVEEMLRKIIIPHQDTETSAPEPKTPQPSDTSTSDEIRKPGDQGDQLLSDIKTTYSSLKELTGKQYSASELEKIKTEFQMETENLHEYQDKTWEIIREMKEKYPYDSAKVKALHDEVRDYAYDLQSKKMPSKLSDHAFSLTSLLSEIQSFIKIMEDFQKSDEFDEADLKLILSDTNQLVIQFLTRQMHSIELTYGVTPLTISTREKDDDVMLEAVYGRFVVN